MSEMALARISVVLFLMLALAESLTVPQLCKNRKFGYKIQDPEDCHRFYVCLGSLGQFNLDCGRDYRFNETKQICVPGNCPPCLCLMDSHNTGSQLDIIISTSDDNGQNPLYNSVPAFSLIWINDPKLVRLEFNSTAYKPSNNPVNVTNAVNITNEFPNPTTSSKRKLKLLQGMAKNFNTYRLQSIKKLNENTLYKERETHIDNISHNGIIGSIALVDSITEPPPVTSTIPTIITTTESEGIFTESTIPTEPLYTEPTDLPGSFTTQSPTTSTELIIETSTLSATELNSEVESSTTPPEDVTQQFTEPTIPAPSITSSTTTSELTTRDFGESTTIQTSTINDESSTIVLIEITTPNPTTGKETTEAIMEATTEGITSPSIETNPSATSTTASSISNETTTQDNPTQNEITTESITQETTQQSTTTAAPSTSSPIPNETTTQEITESSTAQETTTKVYESTTQAPVETTAQNPTTNETTKEATPDPTTRSNTAPTTMLSTESTTLIPTTTNSYATESTTLSTTTSSNESTATTITTTSPVITTTTCATTTTTTCTTTTTTTKCTTTTTTTTTCTTTTTTCHPGTISNAQRYRQTSAYGNVLHVTKETSETKSLCTKQPDGHLVRDPQHCNRYYICYRQRAYAQRCPDQLYFDNKLKVCNYPNLVDCQQESEQNLQNLKQKKHKPNVLPLKVSKLMSSNSPLDLKPGDCKFLDSGTFVRDPCNCNKYYVCLNGSAIALYCPRGQYFDIERYVCNFKSLVKNCRV